MAVEAQRRAPYAADPGRKPRPAAIRSRASPTRSAFRRDRDRIIHSTAFRRLKHKTQVFVFHEGDHYRTRLTHTLEVAQIARALARALGLDEDLAEALALAHDLGHPPFGHAGERALDALPGRLRRLRPQRPDAARRDRAGAPLCRLRRPQPDLGDAGGPGQAQRPADRSRRRSRSAAIAGSGVPRAIRDYDAQHDLRALELSPAPRRRSRRSPTTSPTTPTTSTTACGPACSRSTISPACALAGRHPARDRARAIPALDAARWCTNSCAA